MSVSSYARSAEYPRIPETTRRDQRLADALASAGVPADHLCLLHNGQATELNVLSGYRAMLARTRPGDTLLVYFSGHAERRADTGDLTMALHDSQASRHGWKLDELLGSTDSGFGGESVIFTLDCCYSGSACRALRRKGWRHAMAALGSSLAAEDSSGRWTFSDAWVDCLAGWAPADANRDGRITLEEARQRAARNLWFAEEQTVSLECNSLFPADFTLSPVRQPAPPGAGDLIELQGHRAEVRERSPRGMRVHWLDRDDDPPEQVIPPAGPGSGRAAKP